MDRASINRKIFCVLYSIFSILMGLCVLGSIIDSDIGTGLVFAILCLIFMRTARFFKRYNPNVAENATDNGDQTKVAIPQNKTNDFVKMDTPVTVIKTVPESGTDTKKADDTMFDKGKERILSSSEYDAADSIIGKHLDYDIGRIELENPSCDEDAINDFDFIAIDFETATEQRNSACSVGLAFVKDLEVVSSCHYLIRPPENQYRQVNINIHGIQPEDTAGARCFKDIWDEIYPNMEGNLLVAHNANFDMSVIKSSLTEYSHAYDQIQYIDSMSIAREFVPSRCGLSACTEYFGIHFSNHHNAESDAIACANVLIKCIQLSGCDSFDAFCSSRSNDDILEMTSIPASRSKPIRKLPTYADVTPKSVAPCTNCFDESHPFYEKSIVFTGELSIERKEAMQLVVDVGAVVKSAVSGKTDFLVVGKQDDALVGDDHMSSKEEKAYDLLNRGKAHVKIITETDFFSILHQEGVYV